MQNKTNLLDIQMNVSYVKTNNYEQKTMDNEPIKQSQSKPISIPKTYPHNDPPSPSLRRAGFYIGGEVEKFRHSIIEKLPVTIAKISCRQFFIYRGNFIFSAAAAADGKVCANEAFIAKILFIAGKRTLFVAGGDFSNRGFENITEVPFRFDEKIAGEAISIMFDDDVLAALAVERAKRASAVKAK